MGDVPFLFSTHPTNHPPDLSSLMALMVYCHPLVRVLHSQQAVAKQHNLLRSLLSPLGSRQSAYAICPAVAASPAVVVTAIEKGMLLLEISFLGVAVIP